MAWLKRAVLVCLLPAYLFAWVVAGIYIGAVSVWADLKRDWREAGKEG